MEILDGIEGVLLDIDGTLLEGDRAIPGTAKMIERLRTRSIPFRLSTNTTRMPRSAVVEWLAAAGIDVDPGEVFTPALLARRRILDSGRTRAHLLVAPETRIDFDGIDADETALRLVEDELRGMLFVAPPLSQRQIRRLIYG